MEKQETNKERVAQFFYQSLFLSFSLLTNFGTTRKAILWNRIKTELILFLFFLVYNFIVFILNSFCPTDTKFATCSDDGTIRIWDFLRCTEERILRGHGADVKGVDWHPTKALIASGSKDSQQPVKLWDPKTGQSLATL